MYHSFLIHLSADGWTSRLLPCPSYCKQWCDEHWGTRVSFNSGFRGVYAQQWDCWVMWEFYLSALHHHHLRGKPLGKRRGPYRVKRMDAQVPGSPALSAVAAAKSLQSCPTLCNPIDSSPLDSSVPGILQARTLEWVAISFSNAWKWKVKVKSPSRVRLFAAYQAPPSMGFSRQEYWSGVPLPSPPALSTSLQTMKMLWLSSDPHYSGVCSGSTFFFF